MTCPVCGKELAFIGAAGISDVDGRWDTETTRYRCEGSHMLFVADAARIDEAELDDLDVEEPLIVRRSDGAIYARGSDPQAWLREVSPGVYILGVGDESIAEVDRLVEKLRADDIVVRDPRMP